MGSGRTGVRRDNPSLIPDVAFQDCRFAAQQSPGGLAMTPEKEITNGCQTFKGCRSEKRRGGEGDHDPGPDLLAGRTNFCPKFSWGSGGGTPRHTNTLEHEQYVLRGEATITIGEETHHVKTGDVVFIPEGAIHSYQNTGDEPFEFLCIIPNKEDKITIVEERC